MDRHEIYREIQMTYEEFLEKPLSHRSHELLHTNIEEWGL